MNGAGQPDTSPSRRRNHHAGTTPRVRNSTPNKEKKGPLEPPAVAAAPPEGASGARGPRAGAGVDD